jgi:hypothetical protein
MTTAEGMENVARDSLKAPRKYLLIAAAVMLFPIVVVGALALLQIHRDRTETLKEWVSRVRRPDYRLIYETQTEKHFIAIFDPGGPYVAWCTKSLEPSKVDGPFSRSAAGGGVYDLDGDDLMDLDQPDRFEELVRHTNVAGFSFYECDGYVYPIESDYHGAIRVVLQLDGEAEFNKVLPWRDSSVTQ